MRDAVIYSGAKVDLEKEQLVFDPKALMRYTESIIKVVCEEAIKLEGANLDDV